MESAGPLRKTPLNSLHRDSGAKMVAFGGWEMPVEYSGLISEHMAVRRAAGLFDVSHMGQIEVSGPGAAAFLQRVTCNNVARLSEGRAQYTALPLPNGAPVDDVVLSCRGPGRYLLVANASNVEKDVAWLRSQAPGDCEIIDQSASYALLALQGPAAPAILQSLTACDLGALGYYQVADADVSGQAVRLSRNGYTGEDGFEIMVAAERAPALWTGLLAAGRDQGLLPAGLGARDTLRLEARMCLYGRDIDETTTLVEAGLGWIVSLDEAKGEFNGRSVLAAQKREGSARRLVGFEIVGRGIARHGYPVYLRDDCIGSVTSGTYAPFLQKSIGLCYFPSTHAAVGTAFEVEVRGHRVAARLVETPFYKRPR